MCKLPNFLTKHCANIQTFSLCCLHRLNLKSECVIIWNIKMTLLLETLMHHPRRNTKMMKRVLALILCLCSVLLCFTACAKDKDDKGAYIRMYLTEPVYDLDPLNAFDNEAALQLTSMIFENLFYADDNGKPQKGLWLIDLVLYEG